MINLDNFNLHPVNPELDFENEFYKELISDKGINRYLGEIFNLYIITKKRYEDNFFDSFFFIEYNGNLIGINIFNKKDDGIYISSGILKKYRGNHLAAVLLDDCVDYLLINYPDCNIINLEIEEDNIASIKTATLVGFEKEEAKYTLHRYKKEEAKHTLHR